MRDIRIKTNGFEITEKRKALIKKWEDFIFEFIDVDFIYHFYYDDMSDMVLVILRYGHYGYFVITDYCVSFNGYFCEHHEYLIFEKSTELSKFDRVVL